MQGVEFGWFECPDVGFSGQELRANCLSQKSTTIQKVVLSCRFGFDFDVMHKRIVKQVSQNVKDAELVI